MSTFGGMFGDALPGVSCDRFDGDNDNSDQFFLSHCHSGNVGTLILLCPALCETVFLFSDHMEGLDKLVPLLRRKNSVKVNNRIYCSMISKAFLVRKYPNLDERYVKDLFPNQGVEVNVFDKKLGSMYKLRVTGVPANHCPGSVM